MKRVQKPDFSRQAKIRLAEWNWKVNDLAARLPEHHRTAISKVINGKRKTPSVKKSIKRVLGL